MIYIPHSIVENYTDLLQSFVPMLLLMLANLHNVTSYSRVQWNFPFDIILIHQLLV